MRILQLVIILLSFSKALSQNSYNVQLLNHWTDTTLLSGAEDAIFSDLWGFKINNQNYLAVGSTEGTHILKIENSTLVPVDFKAGKFSSSQVQHRDYKTYKNYLYAVCDEGGSSLQIFDLSYLPDSIHTVYDSDQYFSICHNIFIDTTKAKLYACGPNNSGLTIFDISNPVLPTLFYEFTNVNYVHDCYVTNDTAFLNCGPNGLHIYDFSSIPIQQIGLLDFYADQGYNHSGWLSEDRKKYVFMDENKGKRVKICRIDELANIEVSETYATKNHEEHVAHNVQIFSDFAFISYYNEGLRIIDLQKPTKKEVAFYDTFQQTTNYKLNGAWGVYVFKGEEYVIVSDRQNGIFMFHFPISAYRNANNLTTVQNHPFINENSKIIYPSNQTETLVFSIFSIDGKVIYNKAVLQDWIDVPLNLNSGTYCYFVSNLEGERLTEGKFVVIE